MVKDGIYKKLSEAVAKRGIFEPAESLWLKSRQLLPDGRHALLAEELTLLKFMADDMSLTGTSTPQYQISPILVDVKVWSIYLIFGYFSTSSCCFLFLLFI